LQAGAGILWQLHCFALGILSLGNRVPLSLKIFLTALAVIDDLGRLWLLPFYLKTILWSNLYALDFAMLVLFILNRMKLKFLTLLVGLLCGGLCYIQDPCYCWELLLAFVIPFGWR
jgi:NhaA family Na+:H+ antiporter